MSVQDECSVSLNTLFLSRGVYEAVFSLSLEGWIHGDVQLLFDIIPTCLITAVAENTDLDISVLKSSFMQSLSMPA